VTIGDEGSGSSGRVAGIRLQRGDEKGETQRRRREEKAKRALRELGDQGEFR